MRERLTFQANVLGRLQKETGTPIVVAVRESTTEDGFEYAQLFVEQCWRHGLATFPSIARAANGLARLLEWQRLQQT